MHHPPCSRADCRLTPPNARLRAIGLLLLLASAAACSSSASAASDDAVVLGLTGPFDQEWGATIQMGAELARKQINASGGIGGRRLEFRIENDGGEPKRAIAAAEALRADPRVLAVVGPVTSSAVLAAAPVYDGRLVAVSTSATSPEISGLSPWIFRVAPSDSATAGELARAAIEFGTRHAVLYQNDEYGRGLMRSYVEAMRSAGDAVVEADPYLDSTTDFTPYLERIRRGNVDLVFLAGLHDGAARIVVQAKQMGVHARFIGGDGVELLASLGSAMDGSVFGLLYHPEMSVQAEQFAAAFRAEYGRDANSFAALAFDAVHLLARAAAAPDADRASMRRALAAIGQPGGAAPLEGATGRIQFDPRGDPVSKAFAIGLMNGGIVRLVSRGER